jgi:hypothetical protein
MIQTRILKVEADDPAGELQYELDFMASLTIQQRFDMMLQRSNEIKEMLIKNGHRKPVEIIKRT